MHEGAGAQGFSRSTKETLRSVASRNSPRPFFGRVRGAFKEHQ